MPHAFQYVSCRAGNRAAGLKSAPVTCATGSSAACVTVSFQWMRFSCPDHSRSRSTNFCTLPVEVFGSAQNSIASGHL